MKHWLEELFNAFDHPYTNAEALNGIIRPSTRTGGGTTCRTLRAKMLLTKGVRKEVEVPVHLPNGIGWPGDLMRIGLKRTVDLGADLSTMVHMIHDGTFFRDSTIHSG